MSVTNAQAVGQVITPSLPCIVSAQPNFFVLSLVVNQVGTVISFATTPVVAWCVSNAGRDVREYLVTPIPLDPSARPDVVLYPDGNVVVTGDREFENVGAWLTSVRRG